ncbi:MAG: methyltransferase domain-containing protein [Candidatus Bathyarchaeia archaeon]
MESKRNIKQAYDMLAHAYEDLHGEEQNIKHEAALRFLGKRISGSILDVGCGTGILLPKVENISRFIVGLDISDQMLRVALRKRKSIYSLICADADNIPIRDRVFTATFAFTLIQNMPNPKKTLRELVRVTDESGTIVLTWHKSALSREEVYDLIQDEGLVLQEVPTGDDVRDYIYLCKRKDPSGRNGFNIEPQD